jgi:hypothetical protein
MNAVERLALARAADQLARGVELTRGTYPVNMLVTLAVRGELVKGADGDKVASSHLLSANAVALLLSRLGLSRDEARSALAAALAEAATGVIADYMPDVEHSLEEARRKLPRTLVRGALRAQLSVQEVRNGKAASGNV